MPPVSPDPLLPRPHRPRPDLVDEDPRTTLARVIRSQEELNGQHRSDLAEARNALARLHGLSLGGSPEVARLTVEVAPSLIQDLLANTPGQVRDHVITPFVGAAVDVEVQAHSERATASGRLKRTLYDQSILEDPRAMEHLADRSAMGEVQRIGSGVHTEFCVFGEAAVVAVEVWGDPAADYVVVRDAMLIAAFSTIFDLAWEAGHDIPAERDEADDERDARLLDLLARGLKDEAIARYLGWSLRTVRRRIARLMRDLGATTRFQLGAEAVRLGRLPSAGSTAYPGQLGPGSRSR